MFCTKVLSITGLRTTEASCTAIRNCATVFGELFMSEIWATSWSQRYSMGFISRLWNGQFMTHHGSAGNLWWLGYGRWLLHRVRDYVVAHVCTFTGPWYHPAQTAHFCHHSEIQPIRWQMDWQYHMFPVHKHQCASHPTAYAPDLIHLCSVMIIIEQLCFCHCWQCTM